MVLQTDLETLARECGFSGVVTVSRAETRLAALATGLADRANEQPIDLETRFALASVTKGPTALTVASLIESGELAAHTTLRSLLPDALPLVDPSVTIEQLLAHTSGIGDYLDEAELGDIDDYVMTVPVHRLVGPMDYLPMLDGHPQKAVPGSTFAYNNSGYVLLAIAIELATGRGYHEVVQERVLDPAGMRDTSFARTDQPVARAAHGYLENGRTNVLHLPVRGAGDGGLWSTASDLERFWQRLFDGQILPLSVVERLVAPHSDVPTERRRYGLGFWLSADRDTVMLEGMDAGISCRTAHDRTSGITYVVLANTSSGAWPLARLLDERLPSMADAMVQPVN